MGHIITRMWYEGFKDFLALPFSLPSPFLKQKLSGLMTMLVAFQDFPLWFSFGRGMFPLNSFPVIYLSSAAQHFLKGGRQRLSLLKFSLLLDSGIIMSLHLLKKKCWSTCFFKSVTSLLFSLLCWLRSPPPAHLEIPLSEWASHRLKENICKIYIWYIYLK